MKRSSYIRISLPSLLLVLIFSAGAAYAIDFCGNGFCDGSPFETCQTCPQDCGSCSPPPPPSGPLLCEYSEPWWPFWSGQDELPPTTLRVLANGKELVDIDFCFNPIWVKIGDLRKDLAETILNELNNLEVNVVEDAGVRWKAVGAGLRKLPLETLLFWLEFQSGNVELYVLTHDLDGFVALAGPVNVTADFSMPSIFSEGVLKPLEGRVDDWVVEFPKSRIRLDAKLPPHLASPFVKGLIGALFDGAVENMAFGKLKSEIEQLDPNDLLGSFLGPSAEILQAINDAADFLGIDLPSPPSGTRFSLYVQNPSSDGSSGGEIIIAFSVPPPPPTKPRISAPAYITADWQEEVTFTVQATDPNGDQVEIFTNGLPSGATLAPTTGTGSVSATFNWIPAFSDFGRTYEITFTAQDEHGEQSSSTVTIIALCGEQIECLQ